VFTCELFMQARANLPELESELTSCASLRFPRDPAPWGERHRAPSTCDESGRRSVAVHFLHSRFRRGDRFHAYPRRRRIAVDFQNV